MKKHASAPLSLDARLTFAANQRPSGNGVFRSVSVLAYTLFIAMHKRDPDVSECHRFPDGISLVTERAKEPASTPGFFMVVCTSQSTYLPFAPGYGILV